MMLRWAVLLIALAPLLAGPVKSLPPEYFEAWKLAGQFRFDEAIPVLKDLIRKDRNCFPAYLTLADAFYWSRRVQEGAGYFQLLAEQDQSNGLPLLASARLLGLNLEPERQSKACRECVRRNPDRTEVLDCYNVVVGDYHRKTGISLQDSELDRIAKGTNRLFARMLVLREKRQIQAARQVADEGLRAARAVQDSYGEATFLTWRADLLGQDKADAAVDADLREAARLYELAGDLASSFGTQLATAGRLRARKDPSGVPFLTNLILANAKSYGHLPQLTQIELELGLNAESNGNYDQAINSYRRMITIFDRYDPRAAFGPLERIGHCYKQLGEHATAVSTFEEMLSRSKGIGYREALALRYLGDLYAETGDYARSIEYQLRALRQFRAYKDAGGQSTISATLIRIGKIYAALSDYSMAESYFMRALAIIRRTRHLDPEQRLFNELGNLHLATGRPQQALADFARVRQLGKQTLNPVFEIPAVLNQSRAYRALKLFTRADEHASRALELAREHGMRPLVAEAMLERGEVEIALGKLDEARNSFKRALEDATSIGLLRLAVSARQELSQIALLQGDKQQAMGDLLAAIGMLEEIRYKIPGPHLRASFAEQTWRVYQDAIRLLMQNGQPERAFELSERGRSRAFLDLLAESSANLQRGLTAEQRKQQADLTSAISRVSAEMLSNPSSAAKQRLVDAQQQLQSWLATLHSTSPEYKDLRYPEPLNLRQVQSALPDDRYALVSFILDTPTSFAFVITRNGFNSVRLQSRRSIESSVTSLRALLSVPPRPGAPSFEGLAVRLHRAVFQPLQASLQGRSRIILVADGMLHYMPFEALISRQNPTRYLAEDFTIAYAPSASVFQSLSQNRQRQSASTRMELLAFADPSTATGAPRSEIRGVLERQGLALGPIPNSRIEVDRISRLYPSAMIKTFVGPAATEEALKREPLARYRQIHIATHAVIDEQLPIRSGIVLSPSGMGEDGLLTLAEIYNLDFDAELVTLSACQSGLGKLVRGEGIVGLTRALFYAGASRVAVSLWNVNDVATAPFMEKVYRAMRSGRSPAEAFSKAKQQMIHSLSAGLQHPYYWAPFVLAGRFQ